MGSGVAGSEVEGSMYWRAPEGDDIRLTYTAGLSGYLAEGDHLPLSPEIPAVPEVVLPVMVDYTPEVAAARDAFMETFNEAKMKAEEEMVERRRRDVDMDDTENDKVAVLTPFSHLYNVPHLPLTHTLTHTLTQPQTQPQTQPLFQPLTSVYVPTRTVGQYQYPQYPVFNYPGLVWSYPGQVQGLV